MKGGFGGMNPGNIQNLMRQAQKMQAQMEQQAQQAEEKLQESVISATSGGGMVSLQLDGKRNIKELKINPQAVDAEDVEMLEDLIVSCFQDALKQVDDLEKEVKPNMPNGMF